MKKKILASLFLLLALLLSTSIAYATDDNSMLENAANGIGSMVNGAGSAVGGAVKGIGNATGDMGRAIGNTTGDMGRAIGNTVGNMGNSMESTNNSNRNYTATRTSTTGSETTLFGLDSNTWVWMVVILSVLAIGILVYSYFAQNNTRYENSDD